MADDEVVETATTEETAPAEEAPAEQEASAETENTGPAPDVAEEENRIPYARFSKVVQERNAAREEIERLKTVEEEPAPEPEADDARAQARKMIEEDTRAMLEREFGMPLAEVKTRIAASDNYGQDYVERQWVESCKPHKLDPQSEDLQAYVGGKVKYQGVDLDTALKAAAKIFGKPQESEPTASVEDGGVTGTMTKSDQVFWDAKSASEAAKKGIKSPHVDIMDILNKRRAESS